MHIHAHQPSVGAGHWHEAAVGFSPPPSWRALLLLLLLLHVKGHFTFCSASTHKRPAAVCRVTAFTGATEQIDLKFLCSFILQSTCTEKGNCVKVRNHLGCSWAPFIMYASAVPQPGTWLGLTQYASERLRPLFCCFYSHQQYLNWTSEECWSHRISPALQIHTNIYWKGTLRSLHRFSFHFSWYHFPKFLFVIEVLNISKRWDQQNFALRLYHSKPRGSSKVIDPHDVLCFACRTWNAWPRCGWTNTPNTSTSAGPSTATCRRETWRHRRSWGTGSTARTSSGSWARWPGTCPSTTHRWSPLLPPGGRWEHISDSDWLMGQTLKQLFTFCSWLIRILCFLFI